MCGDAASCLRLACVTWGGAVVAFPSPSSLPNLLGWLGNWSGWLGSLWGQQSGIVGVSISPAPDSSCRVDSGYLWSRSPRPFSPVP